MDNLFSLRLSERMPKYSKLPPILCLVACLASLMVSAVGHGDDTRGNAVRGEESSARNSGLSKNQTLLRAQHVHTADGQVFSPGEVLVVDGKIEFVGPSLNPERVPQHVVEAHTLMPGLVNAFASTGLAGGNAEITSEVTPDFSALSAIDWLSRDFVEARNAGVTTIQVLPATENVFSGMACVVKTAGTSDERILSAEHAVVMSVSSDPTSRNRSRSRPDSIYVRQPTNRMGVVWIVRSALQQALASSESGDLSRSAIELLAKVASGEQEVCCVSRTDFDIRTALQLGNDYGYQPTIYGGDEVYRMFDEFALAKAKLVFTAVTAGAMGRSLRGTEGTDLRWNVPGKLQAAGIEFCLAGDQLLDQAQFAVRYGLAPQKALQAVTIGPAKILRIDDRVGSIAVGKDADFVALNGDPLQFTSAIGWVMIDGKVQFQQEIN
jgi:imidazolonepropionase-like amidohydrolase